MKIIDKWLNALYKLQFKEARLVKAKEIHICRKYLQIAKQKNLSKKSPTVLYWQKQLFIWKKASIPVIQMQIQEGKRPTPNTPEMLLKRTF